MFSAAELLDVLTTRFRRRFPLHPDRPFGEFPPTWRAWFLAMAERPGTVKGVPVEALVAVLRQREPRPVPRAMPALTRWQAARRMLRQQWDPAPQDQRGLRRFAAAFSAFLHLCFGVALLWLGFVAIGDAPPQSADKGEETVRVEFIGKGTPDAEGGAPAQGERDAAAQAAAGSPPTSTATPAAASAAASAATAEPRPPAAQPAAAQAEQPVAVSETPVPDDDFVLPPPTTAALALPQVQAQVRVPTLAAQDDAVETLAAPVDTQALRAPVRQPAAPRVPTLRQQETEIEMVQTPVAPASDVRVPVARAPELRAPALRTAEREIEMRAPPSPSPGNGTAAPSPAKTPGNASGAARTAGTASPTNGGTPDARGSGRLAGSAASGAGTTPSPKPGAVPSPVRGDDWGVSNRNVPGNSTAGRGQGGGLLNGDGRARLPGDNVGGGLPPGTIIEDFEKIDRMGTWLKRPPIDYTPTRFDRFWIPHENLLEEWVRRGVKTVRIPIPGTTKRIECTVSLLQAGGGCRIFDPNLQDQPATARKPPDVPFKPELQEDQDALLRPAPPDAPATPAPQPSPPKQP